MVETDIGVADKAKPEHVTRPESRARFPNKFGQPPRLVTNLPTFLDTLILNSNSVAHRLSLRTPIATICSINTIISSGNAS